MFEIKYGTVKFFRAQEGWGFIRRDDGGEDVYFHVNHFSGVTEEWSGELELNFAAEATLVGEYRPAKPGDKVAFVELKQPDGRVMALHWIYAETLTAAEQILAARPESPANYPVRVATQGDRDLNPVVIWEGSDKEFQRKLDQGFPEMLDEKYFVERLEINGEWRRGSHPANWHNRYKKNEVTRV